MPKRKSKISKQVYKNKRLLKKLSNNIEYKYYDGNCGLTTIPNTGDQHCLNVVDNGDLYNQKEGREITSRRIMIRGYVNNNNGTPADGVLRIMLVRYHHAKGATLTVPDVLYNDGAAATSVNSMINMENKRQFDIIADTTFGYDTTQHTQIPFKIKKKLDHKVIFNTERTSGTSAADIELNSLWFLAITNQATEANAPSITAEYRYSFCDA